MESSQHRMKSVTVSVAVTVSAPPDLWTLKFPPYTDGCLLQTRAALPGAGSVAGGCTPVYRAGRAAGG